MNPINKRMKAAVDASVAAAKLLGTVGTLVEVVRDAGPTTFTWTTSKPWALGHGVMVVKMEGVSGGYDCSRVTPLDHDETVWTKVAFEDEGQDFSEWCFANKEVQWCDWQGDVWGGAKVLNPNLVAGDRIKIRTKAGGILEIRYPIKTVEQVLKRDIVGARLRSLMKGAGKAVAA